MPRLVSSNPPASASQSVGITGISHGIQSDVLLLFDDGRTYIAKSGNAELDKKESYNSNNQGASSKVTFEPKR